ncbi:MAG: hypothetical protein QM535_21750, partial [Limnohabitans sp.]|nr:hypothetical protein [Limnohabitans sp.]
MATLLNAINFLATTTSEERFNFFKKAFTTLTDKEINSLVKVLRNANNNRIKARKLKVKQSEQTKEEVMDVGPSNLVDDEKRIIKELTIEILPKPWWNGISPDKIVAIDVECVMKRPSKDSIGNKCYHEVATIS